MRPISAQSKQPFLDQENEHTRASVLGPDQLPCLDNASAIGQAEFETPFGVWKCFRASSPSITVEQWVTLWYLQNARERPEPTMQKTRLHGLATIRATHVNR